MFGKFSQSGFAEEVKKSVPNLKIELLEWQRMEEIRLSHQAKKNG